MSDTCCCCKYFSRGVEEMVSAVTPEQAAMGFSALKREWNFAKGHCHRHAPFTLSGTWPVVDEHSSCGDFAR